MRVIEELFNHFRHTRGFTGDQFLVLAPLVDWTDVDPFDTCDCGACSPEDSDPPPLRTRERPRKIFEKRKHRCRPKQANLLSHSRK
jgi:hypothetical protein